MLDGIQLTKMRKIIIAGTYAQYRDWLVLHQANPRAAVYVHRLDQLRGLDPDDHEIVLVGTYAQNEVYGSPEYGDFISRQLPLAS